MWQTRQGHTKHHRLGTLQLATRRQEVPQAMRIRIGRFILDGAWPPGTQEPSSHATGGAGPANNASVGGDLNVALTAQEQSLLIKQAQLLTDDPRLVDM